MASGTMPPVASTTVPLMYCDCAITGCAMRVSKNAERTAIFSFMEEPKPGRVVLVVFAAYQMFLQAFFMGLLFLIAGYFVPGAFDRKGLGHFLRDRSVRLGIPSLIYMVAIQPLIVYWLLREFADHSRPPLTQAYIPDRKSTRLNSSHLVI